MTLPVSNDGFEDSHEDICCKRPLVSFVQQNDLVLFQHRVRHGLSEQHTVSHVLQQSLGARAVLEPIKETNIQIEHIGVPLKGLVRLSYFLPDRVSNFLPQADVHLFADPLSD